MDNAIEMLESSIFAPYSALWVYAFARMIVVTRSKGCSVSLHRVPRMLLLPFSKCNTVSIQFIAVTCCCYIVILMSYLRCVTPFSQEIENYEFNILCASMYIVAGFTPLIPEIILNLIGLPMIEKIEYLIAGLIFIPITVVGIGNTAHIVFKLLGLK